jgi:Copper type II ascorbate-dependent monooxygenase, C-terminal domain
MDDEGQTSGNGRRPLVVAAGAAAILVLGLLAGAPTLAQRTKAPSFKRDVAPILADRCTGCHQQGGIAPFALETAAGVHRQAAAIATAVTSRRMPPWPPGPASPAFVGSELRTLTRRERDVLVRWAAAGGPVDRAVRVARPAPVADEPLPGETARRLELPVAYTPRKAGGATDDYRCFLLDPALGEDVFVTSARIDPGVRSQVHHVILFKVPPDQVAEAEGLDANGAGQGWGCFGGTGLDISQGGGVKGALSALDDAPWLAAWAPGATATRLPAGLGIPLAKGSRLVMQVHYNLLNGARPDRSTAVLTTVPESAALKRVDVMLLPAPVELPCPAGATGPLCSRTAALDSVVRKYGPQAAYTAAGLLLLCGKDAANPPAGPTTYCDRRVDRATTILGVGGHMHLLGKSIRVELNPGTPTRRILLDIPRWDFHWQGLYRFVEPIATQPGDTIRVTCRYDQELRHTAGHGVPHAPRYVVWGEGTTDEMCLAVLQVVRG